MRKRPVAPAYDPGAPKDAKVVDLATAIVNTGRKARGLPPLKE
jgi:hypothetical protein